MNIICYLIYMWLYDLHSHKSYIYCIRPVNSKNMKYKFLRRHPFLKYCISCPATILSLVEDADTSCAYRSCWSCDFINTLKIGDNNKKFFDHIKCG